MPLCRLLHLKNQPVKQPNPLPRPNTRRAKHFNIRCKGQDHSRRPSNDQIPSSAISTCPNTPYPDPKTQAYTVHRPAAVCKSQPYRIQRPFPNPANDHVPTLPLRAKARQRLRLNAPFTQHAVTLTLYEEGQIEHAQEKKRKGKDPLRLQILPACVGENGRGRRKERSITTYCIPYSTHRIDAHAFLSHRLGATIALPCVVPTYI